MSAIKSKSIPPMTPAREGLFVFCAIVVIVLAALLIIVVPVLCLANYEEQKAQTENFKTFNTQFSTLPELQELYNLSAINSTWFDLKPLSLFSNWDRIGSDSLKS